jgi:hypothetical protein
MTMPKTKTLKSRASKSVAGVCVVAKPRKKNVARTAYSKEHPSPNKFVKGQSGNPLGRFPGIGEHLFSRNAPAVLGARADDETCKAYGLPTHSSVSMCILRRAALDAMRSSDPAVRASSREFLLRVTEGTRISADLTFPDPSAPLPVIELVFLQSDGNGRPAPNITIEAAPPPPALPVLPAGTD